MTNCYHHGKTFDWETWGIISDVKYNTNCEYNRSDFKQRIIFIKAAALFLYNVEVGTGILRQVAIIQQSRVTILIELMLLNRQEVYVIFG